MSTKLYVGNINFNASEDELLDLFSQHGNVLSAKIITDRDTGRSKGFGFIEMEDSGNAESAISALNQMEWLDRKIVVNEARARSERPRYNSY